MRAIRDSGKHNLKVKVTLDVVRVVSAYILHEVAIVAVIGVLTILHVVLGTDEIGTLNRQYCYLWGESFT